MFKSNNREIQSLNEYVYTYNDSLRDTKCVVYKEDSVIFPLTVQQVKCSDGSVVDVRVSDVDLLLNQKRLENSLLYLMFHKTSFFDVLTPFFQHRSR